MRKIDYLSPTSFSLWKKNREDFYVRYLMEKRLPKEPQNLPMAAGSAFDAYVKSYLFEALFGRNSVGSEKYEFENLFISQVEEHNRDEALEVGKYLFEQYRSSGVLGDLLGEIRLGKNPRFEFNLFGEVSGYREGISKNIVVPDIDNVGIDNNIMKVRNKIVSLPLSGKPDVSFITEDDIHVILDFKVNGYYSEWNTSPVTGYVRLRGAGLMNYGKHKDAITGYIGTGKRILINLGQTLDRVKEDWARQLTIYAWLTGSPVGSDDFIVAIDQLVCNSGGYKGLPLIKIAEHRLKVDIDYQWKLFGELMEAWDIINSGWIFKDMSRKDSDDRCAAIDKRYGDGGIDPFLMELIR